MLVRVNDAIKADMVLLIDESGKSLGQVNRDQALVIAYDKGLDLVELGPNSTPPVVKIIEYGKFIYAQQKKQRKSRGHSSQLKEIKLSFKIEGHDWLTKINKAKKFISDGDKVKLFMPLRGREQAFQPQAREKLERFAGEIGRQLEAPPKKMGRTLSAIIK